LQTTFYIHALSPPIDPAHSDSHFMNSVIYKICDHKYFFFLTEYGYYVPYSEAKHSMFLSRLLCPQGLYSKSALSRQSAGICCTCTSISDGTSQFGGSFCLYQVLVECYDKHIHENYSTTKSNTWTGSSRGNIVGLVYIW
jgi:hypothetical protein